MGREGYIREARFISLPFFFTTQHVSFLRRLPHSHSKTPLIPLPSQNKLVEKKKRSLLQFYSAFSLQVSGESNSATLSNWLRQVVS